jgi:hypothetical protein
MFKVIFIVITAVFLLTGCNSDNNASSDGGSLNNELPKNLDRTDSLAGIDENQNGIRDDIERYIVENYPDEGQKRALFQDAKVMQKSLLVNVSDMTAVKKIGVEMSRSVTCIFSKFKSRDVSDQNPHIASKKIEFMTTNTKERLKAYLRFNKAMDGSVLSSPIGDGCE